MGVCTHIMDHFWIDVGQQHLKHLASSLGTGSSHGHLRAWRRCPGIHPLWNSKAGFLCIFHAVEDERKSWRIVDSLFSTPSLDWKISKFPEIQNSSKVNCLQNARRQAPLESVKSHPFKFPAQLEELSNLVRVMVRVVERWGAFREVFWLSSSFLKGKRLIHLEVSCIL